MKRMRTRLVTVTAVACALGAGAASSAAAGPAAGAQSAAGDFQAGLFHLQFTANRAAGAAQDAATGTFTGAIPLGSGTAGSVAGPVTCLDVVGNTVGLFYPINQSDPSALAKLGAGVYISAKLGADGKPQSAGFLPVPVDHVSSCAPMPALIPVTSGTLTLQSGSTAATTAAPRRSTRHRHTGRRHATASHTRRHRHTDTRRGRRD